MTDSILTRDLYVPALDVWIDPGQPPPRAIITHGHADHARPGHGAVLATPETIAIMMVRYGEDCAGRFQALKFGQRLRIDEALVSLHPAGHILGSAQVRMEIGGQRGLVISDHCGWGELTQSISESGAAGRCRGLCGVMPPISSLPGLSGQSMFVARWIAGASPVMATSQ